MISQYFVKIQETLEDGYKDIHSLAVVIIFIGI